MNAWQLRNTDKRLKFLHMNLELPAWRAHAVVSMLMAKHKMPLLTRVQVPNARPKETPGFFYRFGIRGLFLGALLPCSIAGTALFLAYLEEKRSEIESSALQTARAVAQAVDKDLSGIIGGLQILGTAPSLENGDLSDFHQRASRVASAGDLVDVIALIRPDGSLAMINLRPLGTPLPKTSHPEELRRTLANWKPTVSDFYIGAVSRKPYVSAQVPVKVKGEPHSLLMAVPTIRLAQLLENLHLPAGWVATIVDSKCKVIARSVQHEETVGQVCRPDLLKQLEKQESEDRVEANLDDAASFALKRASLANWTIVISAPKAHLYSSMPRSVFLAGLVTVISIFLALLLAYRFSRHIETSLQSLELATRQDGAQASGIEVSANGPREIADLARRFNEMREARQIAEMQEKRIKRALILLNESNTALLLTDDEGALLKDICRLVVEMGGYLMAWVGEAEHDAQKSVRPLATAGDGQGYLRSIRVSWADTELGQGPTGAAIRTGRPQVNHDVLNNPVMAPWREFALKRGYQASIGLPLIIEGVPIGALTLYAREPDAFQEEEVGLLEKLAHNLSFGIERLRTRKRLVILNQELQGFVYAASHDMRGPLQRMAVFSGMLEHNHREELSEPGRQLVHFIWDNATRIMGLVDDLLSHAQIETMALQTRPVLLAEMVRAMVEERRDDLDACGAEVRLDVPDIPVLANPLALSQVLRNLMDNALKYSAASPRPIIVVGGQHDDQVCRLWVRDNGIGFDMAYHDQIFEIFRRLHTYAEIPGSGVGLALVKKAMDRMGGRVWAESVPGQGATFFIELPVATVESEAEAPTSQLE